MVISKLPRAGLGNKLFVWAHGVVFASQNKLPHTTIGWVQIMIGPIWRGEKSKRIYNQYFISNNTLLKSISIRFQKKCFLSYKDCEKIIDTKNVNYFFTEIPHWDDYFYAIRNHRDIVIESFKASLNKNYKKLFSTLPPIEIGVHIRMGDFKKLNENDDFSKLGTTRTPLSYFEKLIMDSRGICNKEVPVTIFSDGKKEELQEILQLPNVTLSNNNNDLLDLLQLSTSKMIILSAGSTFGQWAAYLSEAIIIHHPHHFHSLIRSKQDKEKYYEGVWNENDRFLQKQLQLI